MDNVFLVNSASFDILTVTSSIMVSENAVVDFSLASTVTGSFSGPAYGLTGVTASYIVPDSDVTSSWANTSSWAINAINGGTQLETGSTYPITSSWAEQSNSASYAPVEPNFSSSVSSEFGTKQDSLVTGTTYTITSSWAESATNATTADLATTATSASYASASKSASYSPVEPNYSASVSSQFGTKQDSLVVGNTYDITSSWAINSLKSDQSTNTTNSISASFIVPGATFYLVSGSGGVSPAYIEPFDYCPTESLYRPPFKEGRLVWDHKYVDYAHYMDTAWRMHLGKEVNIGIHNPSAVTMSRLQPVYISGSTAGNYVPDAYLAIADGTGTKKDVVGIIRAPIGPGEKGFVLTRGEMHNTDVTSLNATIGQQIWLSPDTPGGLTTTKPGQPNETVLIGYVSELGTQGSFIANIREFAAPANAYAGMTSIPTITDGYPASSDVMFDSGSVNLYQNAEGEGAITQYPVLPATFSVPAGYDASFVYVTSNGTTASYEITSNFDDINGTSKVLVATVYRADEDAHWMESKAEGLALANKINIRLLETEKFAWESGFSLVSTGSNYFTVTAGQIWFGATNISQDEFNSFNTESVVPKFETHWAYHSASVWTIPTQSNGKWDSGYYDDGTNLVALGPDSWSCHYVYRILGENPFDEDVFLVTSNYQYNSYGEAQADTIPAGVPAVLDDVSIMVGRLVFQSGSTSATAETSFTTNFGQSTVTQHNSLGGLQGGVGGQYYHLSSADYTGTGTGLIVRADSPLMSKITGSITTASYSSFAEASNTANSATSATTATSAGTATVATSASYASQSLSSSFSPIEPAASASFVTQLNSKQSNLVTGNTYTITASWAEQSTSSSYAPVEPNYSSSAAVLINTKQDTLVTGNTYTITSSWSEYSTTATTAMTTNYATYAGSASYASQSLSASWAPGGVSGTTLYTASLYQITASWAETSSWAVSASWAPGGQVGPADSASWASSSISASYAPVEPNFSASVSTYFGTKQDSLVTGNTYTITSSWANNAISASYSPTTTTNTFSRGGTFYDPLGLAGPMARSQSVYIWRAPFACTATAVYGIMVANAGNITASVTAERNGLLLLTLPLNITASNSWSIGSVLQNNSFAAGDRLEITLITCSVLGVTQSAVQIDFTRP